MPRRVPAPQLQLERLGVTVRGAVQGVGFRPFVHRLATEIGLSGSVRNSTEGVVVEVEGVHTQLERFLDRLKAERPPLSLLQSVESAFLEPLGFKGFHILASDGSGEKTAVVLADAATCPDCLREINDPKNRRYRYPFTNCTNCGPRFSIIEAVPYDRRHTSMKKFRMCDACYAEYTDPTDRRFHAQPNACPECGPQLGFWDKDGHDLGQLDDALLAAEQAIRDGKIVAVKGLGGFHLMADARNAGAVAELRRRKHREEKPLAVMFPDIASIKATCWTSCAERRLLASPQAPIVLLEKRDASSIAKSVAPGNPYLGAMLPYTPLHHLLLSDLGFPVVATSGNLSDEPICIDEVEAAHRLKGIADHFLVHNRPIVRHVDDSIVRIILGRPMVLRRARGFAPMPVSGVGDVPKGIAVGGHLKNSVAISNGRQVFVSQHIGDLETPEAFGAFARVIDDLQQLLEVKPEVIAHDRHPDYFSTAWAKKAGGDHAPVQHHYAHILSCMAENNVRPPALGIAWDGTGYGDDATIWGGEFLRITETGFDRFAHFRQFPLPGGDSAAKEPRRSAIGILYEIFGDDAFSLGELAPIKSFTNSEIKVLRGMLSRGLNSPKTSSVGRLFDAVASLIGLRQVSSFEGQAAMQLEFIADHDVADRYRFQITKSKAGPFIIDTAQMFTAILADLNKGVGGPVISARFHNTLVAVIAAVAAKADEQQVAISGGCFQNRLLTEGAVHRLVRDGFRAFWHQQVPPNDGGISLGQMAAMAVADQRQHRS